MELPRGMKDFEAEELSKIEFVRKKFIETSEVFGFYLMDPSPIESLSVLETKSGPSIRDEIYFFKDKGEREVALRFDFTIGLTRYVVSQKSLKLPAKISAFGGVWRYDEPQKGRYRYFHQWDIEIYGKPTIDSEIELVEFVSRFFENLNLKNIIIDINHRTLIESFIKKIFENISSQSVGEILRAVDKIQKKSKSEILQEYKEKGFDSDKLEKILNFSQIKGSPMEIEKNFDVSQLENWDDLTLLYDSLVNRDIKNIRINFGIVRGLDYYSGIVFEAFEKDSDLGALVGGGRYDTLTRAFGRDDIGATGVAGGVERIVLTMDKQGINNIQHSSRISVMYVNEETKSAAMVLASKLRSKGILTDIDLVGRSLKKQMESSSQSSFAVIVAPKEFAEKKIVLRNMSDGTEHQIQIDEFISNAIALTRKGSS